MKKAFIVLRSVLPTLLMSFLLAMTVWIVSITQRDPTEERRFTNTVTIELRGLPDNYVMTNALPETVNILMRAPASTWQTIINRRIGATAVVDVSELEPGEHTVPIQIEIDTSPIQVTSYAPQNVKVILEEYETRTYDVVVSEIGTIPAAFRADPAVLEPASIDISGPVSQLDQIDKVRVVMDLNNATETITRTLTPAAINADGTVLTGGLKYSTDKIKVTQAISLRGGYRVAVVKVMTSGSPPQGYVLEGLTVNPAVATIYSSDRTLIDSLPGYIETNLIQLNGITEEATVKIGLRLPEGVTLVGDQTVNVTLQVSAVEGSKTISNVPIYPVGIDEGLSATISPEVLDVFLSGPLPILNRINEKDLYAVLELQDKTVGQYQLTPIIDVSAFTDVSVQSVTPVTIDVTILDGSR